MAYVDRLPDARIMRGLLSDNLTLETLTAAILTAAACLAAWADGADPKTTDAAAASELRRAPPRCRHGTDELPFKATDVAAPDTLALRAATAANAAASDGGAPETSSLLIRPRSGPASRSQSAR